MEGTAVLEMVAAFSGGGPAVLEVQIRILGEVGLQIWCSGGGKFSSLMAVIRLLTTEKVLRNAARNHPCRRTHNFKEFHSFSSHNLGDADQSSGQAI